ncbi:hypothetical protein Slin_1931 [Spirosoma linguale DSM 74]|uniref:Uncharacterized protein n=1 Tax=Spirosoma linguale (strain ATCC 33905 / DSM 74 / LMG 10896 / Claus 1) TaxID=504472 RepID=D2QBU7_SPILD|nr:hypothetical protein Slin_1931 [Spirosoma linguale DSM 74]
MFIEYFNNSPRQRALFTVLIDLLGQYFSPIIKRKPTLADAS